MNIIKRLSLERKLQEQREVLELHFKRLDAYYKANFKKVPTEGVQNIRRRLSEMMGMQAYKPLMSNSEEYNIFYTKGALEEFRVLNEEYGMEFNKWYSILKELNQANTYMGCDDYAYWQYNSIIEELNKYPKVENK